MLIGLSGYARSGKDSVGNVLVQEHGFVRVSFADKLRQSLLALDPVLICNDHNLDRASGQSFRPARLSMLLEFYGSFEEIKKSPYSAEWRYLQQHMGTDVGRNIFGENVWVELAMRDVAYHHVVVTDCRFMNEASAIRDHPNGKMWRVERPGVGPANGHVSEVGLDNYVFDNHIINDGTLEELSLKVKASL